MSRLCGLPAALCLIACLSLPGCGKSRPLAPPAEFDSQRAFRDLKALVALGPRPAGSEAAAKARRYLEAELRRAGLTVETLPFQLSSGGEREGADLVAIVPGASKQMIVFVTHFDTKRSAIRVLVEANAAASGPALLLEIARNAAKHPSSATLAFAFVDGSQPLGDAITESDGLVGSRALVREWDRTSRLAQIRAVVLVESVADPDLQLANEAATGPDERLLFARVVNAVDLWSTYDLYTTIRVHSDQDPFLLGGVRRVYTVLDPAHGGRTPPGSLRASDLDDISHVSEMTLTRTGALTERLLAELQSSK
ncbi:MAG TPA: M28 family peptidase [Myxococcota bacterium]|nr:M28 family peptidase [Myxococcota bacterium]